MENKITQRFSDSVLYNKVLMFLIIAYFIVITLDILINGQNVNNL
jgi:hypothetical protein